MSGFGYNAEYYDAATGMQYLRARYYEPEMMRFSQQDLVRGSVVIPISLNRYLYVQNNPVLYTDPSGMVVKAAIRSTAVSAAGSVKKTVATKTTKTVKSAAKVTSNVSSTVRKTATTSPKASSKTTKTDTNKKQGAISTLANAVKNVTQSVGIKQSTSTNTKKSLSNVRGVSSSSSCAGSARLHGGNGGSFENKATWGEGKLWYEKLINGVGGVFFSALRNVGTGNLWTLYSISDVLFKTNLSNKLMSDVESFEDYVVENIVTNEQWFYGGMVVGDVISGVIGWLEMYAGFYVASSGIAMLYAGIVAMVTPSGIVITTAGAAAVVGSLAVSAVGASAAAAGVASQALSIYNFTNDIENFKQAVASQDYLDSIENLKPQELMDELANSGVKYNPEDVIAVTRTQEGKLVWLESGNEKAGLNHIISEHADDFLNRGITQEQIPEYIISALKDGEIIGYQGRNRPIYEFSYNGETHRVAITVGDNGFIVGANPN